MTELATTPELQRLERTLDGLLQAWLRGPLTDEDAERAYDRNIRPLVHRIVVLHREDKERKP